MSGAEHLALAMCRVTVSDEYSSQIDVYFALWPFPTESMRAFIEAAIREKLTREAVNQEKRDDP